MCRLLLLVPLLLFLTACGTPDVDIEPGELREMATEALTDGDAHMAVRLHRRAADQGDLEALHWLAAAYTGGYVSLSPTAEGARANVPIWTWPGQGERWQTRFERELERRAEAEDADALFMRATRLAGAVLDDGALQHPTETDRAEAREILEALAERGDTRAMIRLGLSARENDRTAAAEWFERATEAGDAMGCWYTMMFVDNAFRTVTAVETARSITRAERCRNIDPDVGNDFSATLLSNLHQHVQPGNEHSVVMLDSLREMGLFEQFPRLEEFVSR